MVSTSDYDVVVVGAGNAGLSAAMSAQEQGASVLVIEKAPVYLRGGNSYFTGGGFRFAYDGLGDIRELIPDMTDEEARSVDVGKYSQADYYADIMRVTEGLADSELVQILVSQSFPTMKWMLKNGVSWVLMYGRQAFKIGDIFKFWGGLIVESVGAGKGLVDRIVELAERRGIEIVYETRATKLLIDQKGSVVGLTVKGPEGYRDISSRAVVLASGGFQSNPEWRARYLGPGWELAKVRGTRFNTGEGIRMAMDIGAQPYGHWSGCHAVAWDLNAPPFGDRVIADLFQKHSYPFGIIVNVEGKRIVDEGADFRNYTYAKYGREILHQPERAAFQIFDEKVKDLLRDEYRIPQVTMTTADTIEKLAEGLGVDEKTLVKTVAEFNEAVQDGEFNPAVLDGKHTEGVEPPKTNWAQKIDAPPYMGYAVTCGITFTFGGLRINNEAQVLDTEDAPMPGLYAGGELVGGLFYHNYAGGSGLMGGSVFGKIAGTSAAKEALAKRS